MITSLGELVLLVWLVGWGQRLEEPVPDTSGRYALS